MANPYVLPIINKLYAGKKITLEFHTSNERESFRQRLYKVKKIQDEALVALLDERKLVLRSEMNDVTETHDGQVEIIAYRSVFWMEEQKELNFSIISIEEIEPEKDDNGGSRQASLSIGMGKADSKGSGNPGKDST